MNTTGPAWRAARLLAEALRARYEAATTGRRWRRPARECPDWCRRGHGCTAGRLVDGEHVSVARSWRRPYGGVVVTRAQTATTGRQHIELRVSVALDADDAVAQGQAEAITAGVDMTVTAILARPTVAGAAGRHRALPINPPVRLP